MKSQNSPQRIESTRVRKVLQKAELLRYRWEYHGRLRELLGEVCKERSVRLTPDECRSIRTHWSRYDISFLSLSWYRLFKALNGTVDPLYIPEETFRTRLEPLLCRRDVSAAYHDKNQLDRLFPDLPKPTTILRNIYGAYFDGDYKSVPKEGIDDWLSSHSGTYFLKPAISGTGSGHNVSRIDLSSKSFRIGTAEYSLRDLENIYVQDFLIQEAVSQHDLLARFHPGSLNTIRIITLRFDNKIRPIAATFRMGNGSHVDNGHAGGLLCGIDLKEARLTPFACNVMFKRFESHPLTGQTFANVTIPSFTAIKDLAVEVHSRLAYFDVLSCDIAVLEDGSPCLIEVNTFGQGVEPHQYLKGAPLFDDQTHDVLTLVARRARSNWNQ